MRRPEVVQIFQNLVVKVVDMAAKIPSCTKNVQGMKNKKPQNNGKVNLKKQSK
jgi:hypothetical protein